ncbi:hypothetical protein AB9K34_23080 [Sedimentitalea sp. XS_ASV28]|uniref:hypothetical protein n=1 Tax=Sedimentitalea sp. XS_ASV28 TaxID=3241296 RepID=UPI0035162332
MRPALPVFGSLLAVMLGGCAPQDMGATTAKARFATYPDSLISALQSACEGPAQTFARPTRDSIECREYLPPDPTAAIILTYDGVPDDLPQLVIRFQTRKDATGYLVENDVYLNVPQKSGPPLHVYQRDPRLNRVVAALYRRSGGTPTP